MLCLTILHYCLAYHIFCLLDEIPSEHVLCLLIFIEVIFSTPTKFLIMILLYISVYAVHKYALSLDIQIFVTITKEAWEYLKVRLNQKQIGAPVGP